MSQLVQAIPSSPQRIFITGASGCIGHYVLESLIQNSEHELFLLLRNPDKLQLDVTNQSRVHILQGDIREIEQFSDLLGTIDTAILIATSWGGAPAIYDINVTANLKLMTLLDPDRIRQVLYFSTASILDRQNQPLREAGQVSFDYIRSKYQCHQKLKDLAIFPNITTLFPTLVFGGDTNKPYSHISSGLTEVTKWIDLIRFFSADGTLHFIHAKDVATVVTYLVDHSPQAGDSRELVLGNSALAVDDAVAAVSHYLGRSIYFQIPLSQSLIDFFIKLFKVRMEDWDRFCLKYRHFTYQNPLTPASFGIDNYCTTVADLFQATGIESKQRKTR
ncbi:nad-dependent epimerase dehydratase [Leptolyngbya sp. Heron Island J]|uniref:NAD-dependent epimerase/dehydratase family protein n=1 Tax=Leptolyngbya sp. Heron Island J TaxID=1385935 RepID=UPI0003B9AA1C|nr:NAD(P)-dependent oxidoreductase [Leptolyngbya sp. Heron Island J]ESA37799.1 nad-dependent epimerase dehydratase [Leptolyngbya sp. Heron Island J]